MYWSYVFLALNHGYIHEPPILHCTCKCPDINSHSADYEVRKVFLQALQVPWQQGSWGQHRAHLGPVGPSCTPCRPDEPCYMGYHPVASLKMHNKIQRKCMMIQMTTHPTVSWQIISWRSLAFPFYGYPIKRGYQEHIRETLIVSVYCLVIKTQ